MPWECKGMDEGDTLEVELAKFDSSFDGTIKENL